MTIIISFVIPILLALFFSDSIKKKSKIFYSTAIILSMITTILGLIEKEIRVPSGTILNEVYISMKRALLATGFFILVMFIGVFSKKWSTANRFYKIRGELAIIASILTLPHAVLYGIRFFQSFLPSLLEGDIKFSRVVIFSSGVFALLLLLPLLITSFTKIRKKLNPIRWKSIQRWSYLFYFLVYIHIVFCTVKKEVDYFRMLLYTSIFALYTILRLIKFLRMKSSILSGDNVVQLEK